MALPTPRPTAPRRIVRDPYILEGEPVFEGTRIPVRIVVLASRYAMDIAEVVDAYPVLDHQSIDVALAFYRAHQEEIDRYIAENEDPSG